MTAWAVTTPSLSEQLLSLLSGDGQRCVVVIEAYVDESGTDERARHVCVGAYAGCHDEWRLFIQNWGLLLKCAGLNCFHATESRCDPLRQALLEQIEQRKIRGFLCSMSKQDYAAFANHQLKSTVGNAYSICTLRAALAICEWSRTENLGPVVFTIEDGQPNAHFVKGLLESFIGDDEWNVASVALAKKRDFVPLQAADFLAHCCGAYQREWLDQLIGDGYGMAVHTNLTRQQLPTLSEDVTNIWREYKHRRRQEKAVARFKRHEQPAG